MFNLYGTQSKSKKVIAFNIEDMKPACWNLQRFFGGTPSLAAEFPPHTWDMKPSNKIKCYPINEEQLKILVKRVEKKHGTKEG
jgi:hypothetical protein|tara:strand:+ start:444 stop:692 length:249 start_codon:yes stop_codon:yes gene_type:complete